MELEEIVKSWSKTTTKPALSEAELKALEVMYKNSKITNDTTISVVKLADLLNINIAPLERLMDPLVNKHFVRFKYETYKLMSHGYEIFESEYDVLSRIMFVLNDLKAFKREIPLPKIAKEIGFGEYAITVFYLEKLQKQGIIKVRHTEKNASQYMLTDKGVHLLGYLKSCKK